MKFVVEIGAGKSTLILTLLGFHKPISGSAHVLGFDSRRPTPEVRARIGYMPEIDSYIGSMTAAAFLRVMAELSGLPKKSALEKAHEALFHVGCGNQGELGINILLTYLVGCSECCNEVISPAHHR
jgi:ABC-2 type transport system ATP-binding protein